MIVKSAILFYSLAHPYDPIIISGERHLDCYEKLFKQRIPYHKSSVIEGFLTEKHAFLDRYDAKYEAMRCHQLDSYGENRALYSEDIWPEE